MKKKTIGFLLSVIVPICMVTACSSGTDNSSKNNIEIFSSTKEASEETDSENSDVANSASSEMNPNLNEIMSEEETIYSSFVGNTSFATIRDDYREDGACIILGDKITGEFTIKDMIEAIKANFDSEDIKEDSVEYRIIDCGNDGNYELALEISFEEADMYTGLFIFDESDDGKLQLIYSNDMWSRKWLSVNKYGYIMVGGSNGAASHSGDAILIDANGKTNDIYNYDEEGFGFHFYREEYETACKIDEIVDTWMEKGSEEVDKISNLFFTLNIIDGKDYYSYGYYDESAEGSADELISECTEAGVEFTSDEEIKGLINQRIEAFGGDPATVTDTSDVFMEEVVE
ncbi:MAG: hypothetical protein K6B41_14585 [Butyrivibrio sp.]|nr:hypothetical protein [Butyrivibrio sp.]